MKVRVNKSDGTIDFNSLEIIIGDIVYRITETAPAYKGDGNIRINKISYGDDGQIRITPCVSNEIIIK